MLIIMILLSVSQTVVSEEVLTPPTYYAAYLAPICKGGHRPLAQPLHIGDRYAFHMLIISMSNGIGKYAPQICAADSPINLLDVNGAE